MVQEFLVQAEEEVEEEMAEDLSAGELQEKLKRLESLQELRLCNEDKVTTIERSAESEEVKKALQKNPDISKERSNLLQGGEHTPQTHTPSPMHSSPCYSTILPPPTLTHTTSHSSHTHTTSHSSHTHTTSHSSHTHTTSHSSHTHTHIPLLTHTHTTFHSSHPPSTPHAHTLPPPTPHTLTGWSHVTFALKDRIGGMRKRAKMVRDLEEALHTSSEALRAFQGFLEQPLPPSVLLATRQQELHDTGVRKIYN